MQHANEPARNWFRTASRQAVEALENRQMMSTVTVTAGSDWVGAINNSAAGDTIKFAAGNYAVNSNVTVSSRTLVGSSGATFTGGANLTLSSNTDMSGFTVNGPTVVLQGTNDNFHGNTVTGNASVYLSGGLSHSQVNHNTFNGTHNFVLTGYPGDYVSVDYNYFDITHVPDGGEGAEAMHLIAPCDHLDVSHNVEVGPHVRWAFEFQLGMTNLTIQDNYFHNISGCGISCATGGDPTAPYANQGENIDISGNTLLDDQGKPFALRRHRDHGRQERSDS